VILILSLAIVAALAVPISRRARLYRESRRHIARLYDPSRYPF
jgi:hypothetical protein